MPPSTRRHYIISYDITDNKQRSRLANILLDYGDRMQKSVFEADLDDKNLNDILKVALHCIGKDDSLRL